MASPNARLSATLWVGVLVSRLHVRHRFLWLGLDQLWPLIILAGFGVYVSLVPLVPNDF